MDPLIQRRRRGQKIARTAAIVLLAGCSLTAWLVPDLFTNTLSMPSAEERDEAKRNRSKERRDKPRRQLSSKDAQRIAKRRTKKYRKQLIENLKELEKRIIEAEKVERKQTALFREDPNIFTALIHLIPQQGQQAGKRLKNESSALIRNQQASFTDLAWCTDWRQSVMIHTRKLSSYLHRQSKTLELQPSEVRDETSLSLLDAIATGAKENLQKLHETNNKLNRRAFSIHTARTLTSLHQNAEALKTQNKDLAVRGHATPEDHPLDQTERANFSATLSPLTFQQLHQLSQDMGEYYKNLLSDIAAGDLAQVAELTFPEAVDKIAHEPYMKDDMAAQLEGIEATSPLDAEQLAALTELLQEAANSSGRPLEGEEADGSGPPQEGEGKDGSGPFGSGGGMGDANSAKAGDGRDRFGGMTKEQTLMSLGLRSELGLQQPSPQSVSIDQKTVLANALPGRRFHLDSERKGYLYIDTWHIIGPWEADRPTSYGKIDFSRIYPPEQRINLDARYSTGKTHRIYDDEFGYHGKGDLSGQLTWQFYQSPTVEVRIPREQLANDALYFAYTEVFFEEETTLSLAIASDDAARIRVNGDIVFEDHKLSPYELSEQMRQVTFKKGINQILVRLVNGPGPCRFSLLLVPQG